MHRLFTIGAIIGAASGTCFAPIMPGFAGCEVCAKTSGNQCRGNGRSFECATSIESCCSNPDVTKHMKYEDCVNSYKMPECKRLVSNTKHTTNDFCMKMCLTSRDSVVAKQFIERNCHEEHYVLNGTTAVLPSGSCFDNWIHGYAQPKNKAAFRTIENVESPVRCQALCQETWGCARWAWQAVGSSNLKQSKPHRCLLKSMTQVIESHKTVFTSVIEPQNFDEDYCVNGMAHECWLDFLKCAPCSDRIKRCVWESKSHIAGWKYCSPNGMCAAENFQLETDEPVSPEFTTEEGSQTDVTVHTTTTPEPTTTTPETTTTTTPETTTTSTTPETTTTTPETTTTTTTPETTTTTTVEPTTTTPEHTTETENPFLPLPTLLPPPMPTEADASTDTENPFLPLPTLLPPPMPTEADASTDTENPFLPLPTLLPPPMPTGPNSEPLFPFPILLPPGLNIQIPTTEFPPTEQPTEFPPTEEPTEFPPTEGPSTSHSECPTEDPNCVTPCDNCEHGIDLKIHEKPKLLRLAIDN